MDVRTLREICLGLPGVFEDWPFGPDTSVMKIKAPTSVPARHETKMFALFRAERSPLTVNLKCDPALAEQLRAAHPEIIPGYHMNKKHWNTIDCSAGLPEEMIRDLIEDSYDLVVSTLSKAQREALGWRGLVDRGSDD
ncbi:putative DNA-binding protein (MmcQ/YjbR family) [Psychromicrobium silvestre]|uniref:Putative DNA-binding protein (MmcQ/YjbR family) n=1 Tax=Psychromicrobium silvestre TaxID=1645614 RepID=A0A7Y9S9B8_9MICC|nr:MmcQ/YjbR family DNA-binding protein [Psychromicrobium silvestre]NYE96187.1 putative DNA-binding protein (MmcQ/YjbR family) [Psychromicrobium silvestre]